MEMMALPLGNEYVMAAAASVPPSKEAQLRAACFRSSIADIQQLLANPGLNLRDADSLILRDMCRIGRADVVKLLGFVWHVLLETLTLSVCFLKTHTSASISTVGKTDTTDSQLLRHLLSPQKKATVTSLSYCWMMVV
ncbi:hypothetical protein EBU99_13930 [bacterium]|nr:hypothetical protein [bacterium]